VHDPSGQERKQARNHQRAGENRDHDAAMTGDAMAMGALHPERFGRGIKPGD
jgi:hypothetical protein